MKKKIKDKQKLRKALRRLGACMSCGGLLINTVPDGEKAAIAPCPACGREIRLPFTEEALKKEEAREALYRYGRAVALSQKRPATHFTFKVNDREIMSDPNCACGQGTDCSHVRIVIVFNVAS